MSTKADQVQAETGWVQVTAGTPSNQVPFTVGAEDVAYYITDAIGSVRMVTGHNGYVFERHDYSPFGVEIPPANGNAQVRFAGGEHDPETGNSSSAALDYFGARHLQTATGRFTSVDPIGMTASRLYDPQKQNRYVYVGNNPVGWVDPLGLFASPSYNCGEGNTCLSDVQREILKNSTLIIRGEALSGEALWNALDVKLRNALLNQLDALAALAFEVEGDVFAQSYLLSIVDVAEDRVWFLADSALLRNVAADSRFGTASGREHYPFTQSFKARHYRKGTIQLSFVPGGGGRAVEVDHDLRRGFGHGLEWLHNKLTGSKTSQDAVRLMLIRNGIPVTPSPDPAFNPRTR